MVFTALFFPLLFKIFHNRNLKTARQENYLGLEGPEVAAPM